MTSGIVWPAGLHAAGVCGATSSAWLSYTLEATDPELHYRTSRENTKLLSSSSMPLYKSWQMKQRPSMGIEQVKGESGEVCRLFSPMQLPAVRPAG